MIETPSPLTVVRLPGTRDHDPIERIVSTVGRVNLDLARSLHEGSDVRPYAVVRRRDSLDIVSGIDAITQALLAGNAQARLVTSARISDFTETHNHGATIRLAFMTPTHFRVSGLDYTLPDPHHFFGCCRDRWDALGWPDLPYPDASKIGVDPDCIDFGFHPIQGGQPRRGFVGVVRFNLNRLSVEQTQLCWTLARFAEWRGVGGHTSYGMGRIRILRLTEQWQPGHVVSAWEVERGNGVAR